MSGLLDILPEDLADDVVAVVREALTNVARHAAARSVEVEISTCPERVTVEVRDDGTGLRPGTRRGGLDNLRRRAERRGGRFEVAAAGQRGTRLHWSVPTG